VSKIAVLIPCYNEALTIKKVIDDFRRELPDADIYVYDNNSIDDTAKIAAEAGAIVRHEYKQGKGNVVKSMFADIDSDIYVMVDGDDTYPASLVHKLIEPVENGEVDMCIGDRLSNGTYQKENKRLFHNFGNNIVKFAINILFKAKLRDIMTGYRAFNKTFVKNMPIMSEKFEIETEMSLYAIDKKYTIREIPIEYRDRPEGSESKLNTYSDGIKVIKTIFKMYRTYYPLRFFMAIAIVFAILSLLVGIPVIYEFFTTWYVTKIPSAVLASSLMILAFIIGLCGMTLDVIARQNRENYALQILNYRKIEDIKKDIDDGEKR